MITKKKNTYLYFIYVIYYYHLLIYYNFKLLLVEIKEGKEPGYLVEH